MRRTVAVAALTLATSLLSACGGSDTTAYCNQLKKDKQYFDSLGQGDVKKFDTALNKLRDLGSKAPKEVAAEWKTMDAAISSLQKALKDAGVSFADLGKAQSGSMDPAKLKKLQALAPKLQKLGDAKVKKASNAIQKHAKKQCNVDLTRSS